MAKINQHIEKLLAYHDYVVVPGLGGFVVQHQSARITAEHISAPIATVGFNSLMQHSDGLLAIEVARAEGITYRKAVEIIESEVKEFKHQLLQSTHFQLGNLGFFSLNENGSLHFVPCAKVDFLPLNIGINELFVSELERKIEKETKKISFVLPTAKTFRYAAAAVLLSAMLMISPQMNDVRRAETADLLSLSMLKPTIETPANSAPVLCPELTETKLPDGIVQNNDSNLYHVVVASLPTQLSADKLCESLKKENFECAHVLKPAKSYRVSIRSFAEKAEAIAFMENLRASDERFETAWVLCK